MSSESTCESQETIASVMAEVVHDILNQVEKESEVWYTELEEGDENRFEIGWTVDVIHALIRSSSGGRSCIVKFHQAELSQPIDAETVLQKVPRELLIFLHKKLGMKL